jgi:hypothetical protein
MGILRRVSSYRKTPGVVTVEELEGLPSHNVILIMEAAERRQLAKLKTDNFHTW